MSRKAIEVRSDIFDIETMPKGSNVELLVEEDPLHTDVEYDLTSEGKKALESHLAESGREAILQWRVGKALLALRNQVDEFAPDRSKASDGTIGDQRHCGQANAPSDHCPRIRDGHIGVVTAIDITHDVNNGCDAGVIAESIRADRDPRVKYIIWNRRICSSYRHAGNDPWVWRNYTGSNPHTKHIHISVKGDPGSYDSQMAWNLSKLGAGV
jgi:hypothetical protein